MNTGVRRLPAFLLFFAFFIALSLPLFARAGMQADAMCNPVIPACPCNQVPNPKGGCMGGTNWFMCPGYCKDTEPGGVTTGHCVAPNKCHGDSYTGGPGGGGATDAGLGQLGSILQQLLGKLMEPKPPSPSSGAGAGAIPPTTPTTGCTGSYFQTSDMMQLSNPCAQYTPPATPLSTFSTGTGTTSCDTLSQLLGTCTNTSPSSCPATAVSCTAGFTEVAQTGTDANGCKLPDQCVAGTAGNQNGNQNSNTVNTVLAATGTMPNTGVNLSFIGMPLLLAPGLANGTAGDIFLSGTGATVFGSSLNLANNTGVAGFFGSDTSSGGQPQGLAAQLCASRPWASGLLLSGTLSAAMFDNLCAARGYTVGAPPSPAAPAPVIPIQPHQVTPPAKKSTPPAATSTASVTPQAQIWAVPASVPLGARTSIFWNTQGVVSCTETSPDGSFNQNTLSGGAATQPLSGATTFTISCTDSTGNTVTGSVTVNLSI